MRRRFTVALLGLVAAAVVLAGLGGLLLARRAEVRDAQATLERQVAGLATVVEDRAVERRLATRVRQQLRDAFELSGFEVVPLDASVPDVDPAALAAAAAGRTTSYRDGRELVAVVPSAGGRSAVVGTRPVPGGLGPAGPWVLLSSAVVLVTATGVASALARRLTAPLATTQAVAGRIAAGDLSARVGDLGADELGDLGRSIDAMAAALEDARGAQRDFLLSVSHDLRTPLTSIRGFGELLADDVDDPEHARIGARIEGEARRLERLVSDLLDLATLGAHRPSLHPTAIDVAAAAGGVVAALGPIADGAAVAIRLDARVPVVTVTDPDRLAQVVTNLVENALGFAVSEVVVAVAPSAGGASVVVTDDGPGIPPEQLPHVFERLRTSRPRTRSGGPGSGLGLAIVAELTAAMGGRITVSSPATGGARFELWLPPGAAGGVRGAPARGG